MNFVAIEKLPEPTKPLRTDKHNFEMVFDEYMNLNAKYVRVDWSKEDYTSYNSACAALRRAIWKFDIPAEVVLIDYSVYLVRTDL